MGAPLRAQTPPVAPDAPTERHLWAYPDGVIVSAGDVNGKLARHKTFGPEATGLVSTLTYVLRLCAVEERERRPAWRKSGAKFWVTLNFGIDKLGNVNGLATNVKPALDAPDCFDKVRQMTRAARFAEGATEVPVKGSIAFEIVILSDEEAQGRGYQFYAAETAFERRLEKNAHWFACGRDEDCTVVEAKCFSRGVNVKHAKDLEAALAERPTPACRGETSAPRVARCANKSCTTAKPRN